MVGVAWIFKVSLFTPEQQWTEAAELPGIHGYYVAAALGVFYVAIVVLAVWPTPRRAKGEIYGEEPGGWKNE